MTGGELVAMAWESTLSSEAVTRERFPYSDDAIRAAVLELEPDTVQPFLMANAAPWLEAVMASEADQ